MAIAWSPPMTSGTRPARVAASTSPASSSQVCLIASQYRADGISHVERLDHPRADVPAVVEVVAEGADPLGELCVPDGRRAHVDTAPSRPQVERSADDGDRSLRFGFGGHWPEERR